MLLCLRDHRTGQSIQKCCCNSVWQPACWVLGAKQASTSPHDSWTYVNVLTCLLCWTRPWRGDPRLHSQQRPRAGQRTHIRAAQERGSQPGCNGGKRERGKVCRWGHWAGVLSFIYMCFFLFLIYLFWFSIFMFAVFVFIFTRIIVMYDDDDEAERTSKFTVFPWAQSKSLLLMMVMLWPVFFPAANTLGLCWERESRKQNHNLVDWQRRSL